MDKTPNYQLSQWVKSDQVRMEDFNADNAKIDGALKAESDARIAADAAEAQARAALAAQVALRGNCKIWVGSYKGTGTYGNSNPTSFTFPALPLFALVIGPDGDMMPLIPGCSQTVYHAPGDGGRNYLSWSGNTATWTAHVYPTFNSQMNSPGYLYRVFAFYQAD